MQIRSARYLAILIAISIVIGLCFVEAGAQKRKKRSRRARRPAAALPSPTPDADSGRSTSDPRIISTADQSVTSSTPTTAARKRSATKPAPAPESEQDALRRTISELSGQLNKLTDKLNKMEEQQRSLVDIERLSRAEQRAETFRTQLRDVQAREMDVQSQLDQVEYALTPENIEHAVGTFGTTHPEVAREQRRRQLEGQKAKLRAQLDQLEQSRVRLEPAIATADAEVDKLRQQMELGNQQLDQPTPARPATTPAETPPPKPPDQ
jgi:small-conductance mechanosensitive channel